MMENLEHEFYKQEWKRHELEKLGETPHLTYQEEMHLWDDYVLQKWDHSTELNQEEY